MHLTIFDEPSIKVNGYNGVSEELSLSFLV
jgi:hypothetical protein